MDHEIKLNIALTNNNLYHNFMFENVAINRIDIFRKAFRSICYEQMWTLIQFHLVEMRLYVVSFSKRV